MDDFVLKHGAVSWTELMTTDVASAVSFYTELFGWETLEYPMDGQTYKVLRVDGKAIGGIMSIPSEAGPMPPHWGSYVTVDDVDAVAIRVVELGGTILHEPMDIPDIGRFCVLADPQGALIRAISYVPM